MKSAKREKRRRRQRRFWRSTWTRLRAMGLLRGAPTQRTGRVEVLQEQVVASSARVDRPLEGLQPTTLPELEVALRLRHHPKHPLQ
jgi:hypothetical protein